MCFRIFIKCILVVITVNAMIQKCIIDTCMRVHVIIIIVLKPFHQNHICNGQKYINLIFPTISIAVTYIYIVANS